MSVHELALAVQSARGTAATVAKYNLPLLGGSVRPRRVTNLLEETGSTRLRKISYVSEVGAEGNPSYAVRPSVLPLLLYGALGSKADSGAADPYTHAIHEATEQPWLTAWRKLLLSDGVTTVYEKFVDCKITQVVLTSEKGQPLKADLTIAGLSPTYLAAATYASEVAVAQSSEDPIMHYDGAGAFLVEAAAVASIERFVLTINGNGSFQQGDSLEGYDIAEGMYDIGLETSNLIEDAALYNRFHYGSDTPSDGDGATADVATLTGGVDVKWTQVAAAPGPERSLRIQLPQLDIADIQGYDPNANNDPLKDTKTYRVMQPDAGNAITATVLNGEATTA
jgi:hypothetical protein